MMAAHGDPDLEVTLGDRPAITRPEDVAPMSVTVESPTNDFLQDGLLARRWSSAVGEVTPTRPLDEAVRSAVRDAGYKIDEYQGMTVDFPANGERGVGIEFQLSVRGDYS